MIVWLASFPRSGNTFLRIMLREFYGIASNDIYHMYDHSKSVDVAPGLEVNLRSMSIQDMGQAEQTYFLKTHDLPNDDYPALYLVRDGRDAYVSYTHFALSFKPKRPLRALFRKRFFDRQLSELLINDPFGGWSENVAAWTQRSAPTAVIRFEDLIVDPAGLVQRGLAEIDYRPPQTSDARVPEFDELRQKSPAFYRKGQVGGWREEMPKHLQDLFWERHGAMMTQMDYAAS